MQLKKLRQSCLVVALAAAAITTPIRSNAVTPDNRVPVSVFWTAAKVLKEWFDWRSALGWGTIGITNVIVTAGGGESGGAITKAVFQFVCGTTAGGIMATIKVPTEPTTTNHIATIVKGASVVGSASLCGWVSKWIYDSVLPPIHANITLKDINFRNTPATLEKISGYGSAINSVLLQMETNYGRAARYKEAARQAEVALRTNNCYAFAQKFNYFCKTIQADYASYSAQAQQYVDSLNANARSLKIFQNGLNKIYYG